MHVAVPCPPYIALFCILQTRLPLVRWSLSMASSASLQLRCLSDSCTFVLLICILVDVMQRIGGSIGDMQILARTYTALSSSFFFFFAFGNLVARLPGLSFKPGRSHSKEEDTHSEGLDATSIACKGSDSLIFLHEFQ